MSTIVLVLQIFKKCKSENSGFHFSYKNTNFYMKSKQSAKY